MMEEMFTTTLSQDVVTSVGPDLWLLPDTNTSPAFNLSSNFSGTGRVPNAGFRPPLTPDIVRLQTIHEQLDNVLPVVLSLGIVGNVMAVLAFMLSPLRLNSLSHYLTALAVSDVMNLLAGLVLWVSSHGWNIYSKVGVCQLTSFVLLMSRFLTIWYLLSAHVERLLVQYGQPGSKRWCTVFRTKCIILAVFVLSLVAFLHYIWSHVVIWQRGHFTCTTMQESVIHINRLRRVELVLALFLPMLIMLGIDVALVFKLVVTRVHTARTRSSSGDSMPASLKAKRDHSLRSTDKDYARAENGEIAALSKPSGREKRNGNGAREERANDEMSAIDLGKERWRSTVMCVMAGLVFMGLTLPSAYLRARMNFAEQKGRFPLTMHEIYLMQVFEKVNQFNAVYKVVLYALFLQSFRRAVWFILKTAVKCRCCKRRDPVTTV